MLQSKEDSSLGELFTALTRQMSTLVRQEVQLAKTEMTEKAGAAVKGMAFVMVATFFAFFALEVLVAAAVIALGLVVPLWLAAVIIGVVLALLAGILLALALAALKKGMDPVPHQTTATIKEDAQWAKEQME